MDENLKYNERLAKESTQQLILNISKFLCENKDIVYRLKYNLDECKYDTGIVIDIEDGLYKLGLSLADLLRYWDDEN
jgi:hypothetical protein